MCLNENVYADHHTHYTLPKYFSIFARADFPEFFTRPDPKATSMSDQEPNNIKNKESQKKDSVDESDTESIQGLDAMNTIMEYNRQLLQRIQELEKSNKALLENTKSVNKKSKPKAEKGTSQTFEFPIGEMLENFGTLDTSDPVNDDPVDDPPNGDIQEEEGEVEGGNIRISDGDRDDIIVKVDATRKGITLTLHIPRNK
ncbi:hypothetical protein BY458DRAFT_544294 [Sporodiniella umbellata]|nr:hypothetical protein BY458DRAFT_544294 [Sporodiniella umbellata]